MSIEHPIIVNTEVHRMEPLQPEQLQGRTELASLTPEQIAAANGLFAQNQEAQQVANLLGLYMSAQLLHHVAIDTFDTRGEEEEEKRLRACPPEQPGPTEK